MVPEAEFRSYYGQPVIKSPVWHEPHMPAYLYLGGLSGAAAVMGVMAGLSGRDRLALTSRVTAALGATAGAAFLVAELGRPERFLNMLRVFKPTSPMSMGSWILAVHSGLTAVAAAPVLLATRPASRIAASLPAAVTASLPAAVTASLPAAVTASLPAAVTAVLPAAGDAASLASGVTGPLMATYTAVLLADTAVPAWHEAHRELPFLFAGSALAAAGAAGMLATPRAQAGPARAVAVLGAALETAAGAVLESRLGLVGEPYHQGRAGRLLRAARVLTAGGGLLAAVAGRGRVLTALSGLALTAGSLVTRFGILEAGRASAADPKYTVVPQRRRLEGEGRAPARAPARMWP
ncbi:Formate-dependent nitrite reductase, membrane component NrfD [Streptosporangium canum]|uniref:Formate-dependent nitrite reductase, membrane component NrfD n=2 Tax=Streptosporangium canum TaxID=324952 RepID=A0A1I3JN31_9ACTN|nr:Formate-dependent nitrite reductase, membrane component NrfD [Streptosporangium canum]